MKKVKWFVILSFMSIFLVTGAGDGLSATKITYNGPPITIRYSTHVAETHQVWVRAMSEWPKILEKESNGKLVLKIYASGSLHGARDGFKACVNDITDQTHGYPIWQPASFDLFHLLDLPFAFPNVYVAALVGEELYPKYLKKEYEKMGVYLANIQIVTPANILSKKPIRKLEDLKGLKIRSGGGAIGELIKRLGAVPVLVTTADVYSAFQSGIIDAVLLYDSGFTSFRLSEIGKYRTVVGLNVSTTPYCFNRKTFDALPKDLKTAWYNANRQLSQIATEAYDYADKEALKIMEKQGVETIILPREEMARWKAVVEPLWTDFIAKNEAKGLPAKAMVKDLQALAAKYSTWTPEKIMKHVKENPIHGIIDGM